jgi:hypothetical protein
MSSKNDFPVLLIKPEKINLSKVLEGLKNIIKHQSPAACTFWNDWLF